MELSILYNDKVVKMNTNQKQKRKDDDNEDFLVLGIIKL